MEVELIFRTALDEADQIENESTRETTKQGIMIYQALIQRRIERGFFDEEKEA
jgi:hypothetical protein